MGFQQSRFYGGKEGDEVAIRLGKKRIWLDYKKSKRGSPLTLYK